MSTQKAELVPKSVPLEISSESVDFEISAHEVLEETFSDRRLRLTLTIEVGLNEFEPHTYEFDIAKMEGHEFKLVKNEEYGVWMLTWHDFGILPFPLSKEIPSVRLTKEEKEKA